MAYLDLNKDEIINLEYSLKKEILSTNRAGGYFSTSIILCNTRKYHGLMVLPIKEFDDENHVLLSSVDETVIQHGKSFNLGIHKFPGIGVYEPRGHKYITDFQYDQTPKLTYKVGGVVLEKELLFVHNEEQFMIRYTLKDAHSPTRLRIKPFLAFRNLHKLSKANMYADIKYKNVKNGIKSKLYPGFPYLYMQLNKKNEFIASPDWYYNIEYLEELNRGYEYQEDLFVPGFFEIPIKKGETIIFSASTSEATPTGLNRKFETELKRRPPKDSFENCLKNSASQFLVEREKTTEIIAGYPWFGRWGRDTFISLPGLTLCTGDIKSCKNVLDTMIHELKGGLFPNIGKNSNAAFNSVDAPLWFFWSVQMYAKAINDNNIIWHDYGKKMKQILDNYRKGLEFNIKMHNNGLIWQGEKGRALTWMDAVVEGKPVTPRAGYAVEINALWYNAVCYTLDLAKQFNDSKFVKEWGNIPGLTRKSFSDVFWYEEKQYLYDLVDYEFSDNSVRPNQIFAVSLPYSPLTEPQMQGVIRVVEKELLTPKGLRTLSPGNPKYHGRYEGNQAERDSAYHQGTVWPWLLGHYVDAIFKIYGKEAIPQAENIVTSFKEDMTKYGLSSISEIFDGDPPQRNRGAISQAWSVAEVLRIYCRIKEIKGLK
ncbi:MAG: amylo-alpha-1,6-glucosidase [Bacteroidetes bacterium GWC2_33_15]|nr:MAG: amylo-alpha-1,6-glucosidase [Bacteroidetes bacterium GWA2_33_15]OFX51163.1 MAG: amylo-alpha-1,6-glucosidase [Bacteroidetes bacterium GWC2_33_15]OFX66404.1 MAG: amylo-alpha-1,6-glucosidase [Bacteroidetes bacterium GWB2_32_14]OFX70371.1 MAG: amylo-alpha-1,6-glucosidase [Bacteroidetes bacterium GWD2_33_33]HAN17377.1 amylo-alpha-1,6-glucosidase [Bacteroidales bacterium]